jgi:uncharacterized repeat protein (TIGR03803 family)
MKYLQRLLLAVGFLGLSLTGLRAGVVFNSLAYFNYTNGAHPTAELVLGMDGNYYGTAHNGGTTNGTVFQMTPAGTVTQLLTFNMSNGANPHAALIQGSNGVLYGTAEEGGTNGNYGTVFQITTNGQLTTLVSFNNTNGSDPMGALVQGPNGTLYGTTSSGGTNGGYGTVFQITTNNQLTTLVSFNNNNGANPLGALVRTTDGTLFGTTSSGIGGTTNGTVFQISTNGLLTTLVSFNGTNGANPYSGLLLAGDGNFYGTTYNGGSAGVGTVFKMTRTGSLSNLASFNNTNGANPRGVLLQGSDGNFYGTTESGGTNGFGSIFKMTPGGTITSLFSFDPVAGGDLPVAGLIQGADGQLYGTTQSGGAKAVGTVYSLNVPMAPVFRSVTLSGGTMHLTWSAVAGRAYQLQWISDLTQTNWINLGVASNAVSGTMSGLDVIGTNTARFYQLQLVSP